MGQSMGSENTAKDLLQVLSISYHSQLNTLFPQQRSTKVFSILGFHSRDTDHGNGCYPPSLCPANVNQSKARVCEFEMVLCIVVGCGRKSGIHKAKFSKIPMVITNQGEEWEELTPERRISAVSNGDTAKKNILEGELVYDRHFVSGKPAATWDKHNIDWVPTLNLGKMEFKGDEQKD